MSYEIMAHFFFFFLNKKITFMTFFSLLCIL